MLSRTANLQWGLGHKSINTIYEREVVSILTYGAPILLEAIRKNKKLAKNKRIQRIFVIKIAKAYRTISYDASCLIAAIDTDSKIILVLLQNKFKRNRLIELIRNSLIILGHLKWIVHFGWIKGHAGIEGNEMVDRLAKEAAVEDGPVVYDKIQ